MLINCFSRLVFPQNFYLQLLDCLMLIYILRHTPFIAFFPIKGRLALSMHVHYIPVNMLKSFLNFYITVDQQNKNSFLYNHE